MIFLLINCFSFYLSVSLPTYYRRHLFFNINCIFLCKMHFKTKNSIWAEFYKVIVLPLFKKNQYQLEMTSYECKHECKDMKITENSKYKGSFLSVSCNIKNRHFVRMTHIEYRTVFIFLVFLYCVWIVSLRHLVILHDLKPGGGYSIFLKMVSGKAFTAYENIYWLNQTFGKHSTLYRTVFGACICFK